MHSLAKVSCLCITLAAAGLSEEVVLSPDQQRRADAAYGMLGDAMKTYFQASSKAVSALNTLPSLHERLEPAYLPTVMADVADIPRKLMVEGDFQRRQANQILEDLGFQSHGGDRIWAAGKLVMDSIASSLLDPDVIKKAFQSPEAQRTGP